MVARNRLPPWHEEIRLGNGRDVLIRPIRPEDAPVLRASFELLQPDDIRNHLLGGVHPISVDEARDLAQPDSRSEFTLVVSEQMPPGEAMILGVARAATVPGTREASFAILVGRNVEGMGLGRHLMRRLARWARGKRLDALTATSRGNDPCSTGDRWASPATRRGSRLCAPPAAGSRDAVSGGGMR